MYCCYDMLLPRSAAASEMAKQVLEMLQMRRKKLKGGKQVR